MTTAVCVGPTQWAHGYDVRVMRKFMPHRYDAIARIIVAYDWQENFWHRVLVMRYLVKMQRQIAALPRLLGICRPGVFERDAWVRKVTL